MRRTTICRSSRAALLALAAVSLVCSALRADDAPRVQDTTPAAAAALGQVPSSHTVAVGETLWSIAQLYFGDPLLWPEIYRLNTTVVEDPHWIYPGEVLVLAPRTSVAQGPPRAGPAAVGRVPSPTESFETIFDQGPTPPEALGTGAALRAYAGQQYRPLRRGEFYSAGFLSEREELPWGRVLGATALPAIHRLSERTSAHEFEEISVEPPGNGSFHTGDSLLVVRIDRDVPDWGVVVVPVGVARVTGVQQQQLLADVILQFGRIRDGQLALPLEPFKDPGQVRPRPIQRGLQGFLLAARDIHSLAGAQQIFFINRGRADGVALGDVFEVYRPAAGELGTASEETHAMLMVVHTREHSASGLVVGITRPDVQPGMPVRLVRKMPS